jgi:hypothetical protein
MIRTDRQKVKLFLFDQQEFDELSVRIVMLLQTSDSQVLHWRATTAKKVVEVVKAVTSLLENGFVGWNR